MVKRSSPPKTPHDLAIAASNRWVLSYENLTSLPQWLSDMLCTCSTSGGYSTRSLFKNREEQLFEFQRPVILNGIADFVTEHADLTGRGEFLHMPPITKKTRRSEREFWSKFEDALPSLFGALLDAVVGGLARRSETAGLEFPRMADFGQFAEAVWRGLGNPDNQFLDTYSDNCKDAIAGVLEDSPVAVAVVKLMGITPGWAGTATDLLVALNGLIGEQSQKSRRWPKRPNKLSDALRTVAPCLRETGIIVDLGERSGHDRVRKITLSQVAPEVEGNLSSASSASAEPSKKEEMPADNGADDSANENTINRPHPDTTATTADDRLACGRSADDQKKHQSSADNPNNTNDLCGRADDADDKLPSSSADRSPAMEVLEL